MIHINASILDGSFYFTISFFMIILSFFGYFIYIFTENKLFSMASFIIVITAFALQTFAFIVRWRYSYHIGIDLPPLTDLYDSLVFFAYVILLGFILLKLFYNFDSLGFIMTFIATASLAFATISPLATSAIEPSIPALRSYWLLYHIISLFLAYGAFAASFGIAILFLIKYKQIDNIEQNKNINKAANKGNPLKFLSILYYPFILLYRQFLKLSPPIETLDEAIYKVVVFGFLFLSIGIVIGAAWADNAWGGYWSWDPKETWSLITWITYAIFIHARLTKGWNEKKMAWIAVIGFAVVIFCYLGVDLIIPGLHSYATPGSTPIL